MLARFAPTPCSKSTAPCAGRPLASQARSTLPDALTNCTVDAPRETGGGEIFAPAVRRKIGLGKCDAEAWLKILIILMIDIPAVLSEALDRGGLRVKDDEPAVAFLWCHVPLVTQAEFQREVRSAARERHVHAHSFATQPASSRGARTPASSDAAWRRAGESCVWRLVNAAPFRKRPNARRS